MGTLGSIGDQVNVLRTAAGVAARPEVRTLEIRGPDRVRFLNGMVTNDVARLAPGRGIPALKTNNRGRVEAVVRIRATNDAFALELLEAVAGRVLANFERYIIMDDCSVSDVSGSREVIAVLGPQAAAVVRASGLFPVDLPGERDAFGETADGFVLSVIRDRSIGIDGFEIHASAGQGVSTLDRLIGVGGRLVSREALEVVRVESGIPIDGVDLDEETLPMEARLEHAISFDKGCYVGQEVIARATNFGHVNHILVGLVLHSSEALVGADAELLDSGSSKVVGEITSVVYSPTLEQTIALGYVRPSHQTAGTGLTLRSVPGGRQGAAVVHELPFL